MESLTGINFLPIWKKIANQIDSSLKVTLMWRTHSGGSGLTTTKVKVLLAAVTELKFEQDNVLAYWLELDRYPIISMGYELSDMTYTKQQRDPKREFTELN